MPMPGSSRNPYVKATRCGHYTTYEYCTKVEAAVYEHIKTVEEGGKLNKDGTLNRTYKELRSDIVCAKCRPGTLAEIEAEKERRSEYARRKKMRDLLEAKCPICGKVIRARRDSAAFESFVAEDLTEDEARKLIVGAHIRHNHSDYDSVRHDEYERLREEGLDWEEAHRMAKEKAHRKKKIQGGQEPRSSVQV